MKLSSIAAVIVVAALLGGCNATMQTTSGKAYLEKYSAVPAANGDPTDDTFNIDEAVRAAASVEPVLRFPARIGLVRIDWRGEISAIPEDEAVHWQALHDKLGSGFGEFVPVNPMIANLVRGAAPRPENQQLDTVSEVRLAAARQHLDAVLIYELPTSSQTRKNGFASADLTIVGAFMLPSRRVQGTVVGNALLIDVVQGYPYGTAQASVARSALSTGYQADDTNRKIVNTLRASATQELTVEVLEMFRDLRVQLAELDRD